MTTTGATETMAKSDAAARCVHQLRFGRGSLLGVLDGIPDDKLAALPEFKDGGSCANHALWLMGHIATTDDYFMKQMGVSDTLKLSEEWHTTFGGGSKPEADASKYPSAEDLQAAMKAQRNRLIKWFTPRTAEELAQPSPEKWRKYAPTMADFASFLAWHEGYHAGQLSVIRKALGLGPAFG